MNRTRRGSVLILALLLVFPIMGVVPMVSAQDPEVMSFVMAYPSDVGEQNPIFARSARSLWYDMLIYDTLISFDENADLIPWLAESWDISMIHRVIGDTKTFSLKNSCLMWRRNSG